jgi:hypothetical protein
MVIIKGIVTASANRKGITPRLISGKKTQEMVARRVMKMQDDVDEAYIPVRWGREEERTMKNGITQTMLPSLHQ